MNIYRSSLFIGISLLLASSVWAPSESQPPEHIYREWQASANSEPQLIDYPHIAALLDSSDPIEALYNHETSHQLVIDFFSEITQAEDIAQSILYYANREEVPISLAFSVAWVESRFDPTASYQNSHSVDRGLFQLNSNSFVTMREEDFFHPETNVRHGTSYLKYCLRRANGNSDTALAGYNAGFSRVRSGRIPESTKVYVTRVIDYQQRLLERFHSYIVDSLTSV